MAMKREKGSRLEERAAQLEGVIKKNEANSNRMEATRQASYEWVKASALQKPTNVGIDLAAAAENVTHPAKIYNKLRKPSKTAPVHPVETKNTIELLKPNNNSEPELKSEMPYSESQFFRPL